MASPSAPPPGHPKTNAANSIAEDGSDGLESTAGTHATGPFAETGANSGTNSGINRPNNNNNNNIVTTSSGGATSITRSIAKDPPAPPADPESTIGANIDLMSKVATFANVGGGLFELCSALGPFGASRIRHDYLLKNDKYLLRSLKMLQEDVEKVEYRFPGYMCVGKWDHEVVILSSLRKELDKCRDNIKAWMKVNVDWRTHCTEKDMSSEKFCLEEFLAKEYGRCDTRGFSTVKLESGAKAIFNNPALVVEIGLMEALQHHVEKFDVKIYKCGWRGIVRHPNYALTRLALARSSQGDTAVLEYMLSDDSSFSQCAELDAHLDRRSKGMLYLGELLQEAFLWNFCGVKCFNVFLSSPKIDLGAPEFSAEFEGRSALVPFLFFAVSRFACDCRDAQGSNGSIITLFKEKVLSLLEAGANPHQLSPFGCTPLDLAKSTLASLSGRMSFWKVWKEIVQKMEQDICTNKR